CGVHRDRRRKRLAATAVTARSDETRCARTTDAGFPPSCPDAAIPTARSRSGRLPAERARRLRRALQAAELLHGATGPRRPRCRVANLAYPSGRISMRPPSIVFFLRPARLVFRLVGILAAQHAGDRLVYPWIDLQVAVFFRGEAEFNRAVAADKGLLAKTSGIFDGNAQQPLGECAAADRTVKLIGMGIGGIHRRLLLYIIASTHCAVIFPRSEERRVGKE